LEPTSLAALQDSVRGNQSVLAVGARSKPRLSQVDDCTLLSMGGLAGITEYQPSEYTFTALAGTPLRELEQILAKQGQAMPFDPLLSEAGSTLGGATATGLSGPCRFRLGGIRDFLLGIQYIDGAGQLIRAGSRVVKNAAGFDVPKLMVGSLGRFGILYELTFKVFPTVCERLSLRVRCTDPQQATRRLIEAASSRWELLALDYQPAQRSLLLQLGGPLPAIQLIAADIQRHWPGDVQTIEPDEAATCWETIRGLGLALAGADPDGTGPEGTGPEGAGPERIGPVSQPVVAQVVLTPTELPDLEQGLCQIEGVQSHYSVGGNVATLLIDGQENLPKVSKHLTELRLAGLVLQGYQSPLWLGVTAQESTNRAIDRAIQVALDPQHRFPSIEPSNP
jgi:glycolate oxidase FAD binding subunit